MRYLIALMLVCIMVSPVDAKLFGRLRNRQGVANKSKEAFPPGTPPAELDDIKAAMDQLNCPDGTCQQQFVPTTNLQLTAPTTTLTLTPNPIMPQPELSIVVEQSTLAVVTPTIASVESDLTILKQQVAEAEASLARLRLVAERTAAIEAIQQRAADEVKRLSIEHTIADLQAELPQTGGDKPSDETQ